MHIPLNKLRLGVIVLFTLYYGAARSQTAILSSGSDASSGSGSVSSSVGQVVYTTNFSSAGSVAQGVQQPFEISIVTAIESASGIILSFSVFPNPTTDFLTLKVADYRTENLSYQLYDVTNKLISDRKISDAVERIPMYAYASGIYFLKVSEGNQELKTFKIIKN